MHKNIHENVYNEYSVLEAAGKIQMVRNGDRQSHSDGEQRRKRATGAK